MDFIEYLAQQIHESAREAVQNNKTVAFNQLGDKARTFTEWDDLSEAAKEGKRMQARYLLDKFSIENRR